MEICFNSVHLIDYEHNKCTLIPQKKETNSYIAQLLDYVVNNNAVREFHGRNSETEVIKHVTDIQENMQDMKQVQKCCNAIAARLLTKEREAQAKIQATGSKVQRGSLIQALIRDENPRKYRYILAKVEHIEFVDGHDFTFKSGFSKERKKIWKTCVLELGSSPDKMHAKVFSDTEAKYWSDDFLELDAALNDSQNTERAFAGIEKLLNKRIKETSIYDHIIIRNTIACYFMKEGQLDYPQMIKEVLDNYTAENLTKMEVEQLKNQLLELPKSRDFDSQFTPDRSVLKTKVKHMYDIALGLRLQVASSIDNLDDIIMPERDDNGRCFLKIKTSQKNFNKFSKMKTSKII